MLSIVYKMLAYIYVVIVAIFLVGGTEGLLLCDGDCMNNTDLQICRKSTNDLRKVITLLGLFPCNTRVFRARGLTPAAQMAINQITSNSSLLPGFRLQLLVNSSLVSVFMPYCGNADELRHTKLS